MRWLYYIAVVAGCAAAVAGVLTTGLDATNKAIATALLIFVASALIGRWQLPWVPAAVIALYLVVAAIAGGFEDDGRGDITGDVILGYALAFLAAIEMLVALGVGTGVIVREALKGGRWDTAPR